MKDKAFARSVSREDIVNGAAELGVDLDEHITFCIEAMKGDCWGVGVGGEVRPLFAVRFSPEAEAMFVAVV